ncbi:hypothetical protein [Nocardia cyriacigeorgica]|uniref:Uncharacterized protein n=1 Tax=Nocardia cyriacigeorgica TaxID=135487 RepID=A0A6P1DH81_9NOCA|nr:hypothetical protein [Nocardia cyriacigeorgica]NEW47933.1 hypothetical protein [Nocardia cyriacigeorgica]
MSDGGGIKRAAQRPVIGVDKVVRYILSGIDKLGVALTCEPTTVNGHPALLMCVDGAVEGVMAFAVTAGRITGIYFVLNPQKLTHLDTETALTLR